MTEGGIGVGGARRGSTASPALGRPAGGFATDPDAKGPGPSFRIPSEVVV